MQLMCLFSQLVVGRWLGQNLMRNLLIVAETFHHLNRVPLSQIGAYNIVQEQTVNQQISVSIHYSQMQI